MSAVMRRAGLAGLIAASTLVLAAEIVGDAGEMPPVARAPGSAGPAPATSAQPPERVIPVLTARPLFVAGRRYAGPSGTATGTAAEDDAPVRLVGVIAKGERRLALVEVARKPKPVVVEQGATIGRWTVDRISAREVTLAADGEQRVLRPAKRGAAAKGADAPAADGQPGEPADDAAPPEDGSTPQ